MKVAGIRAGTRLLDGTTPGMSVQRSGRISSIPVKERRHHERGTFAAPAGDNWPEVAETNEIWR